MKIKRHHRKTIVTDLYTVEHKNELYFFITHTNGKGKEINKELRKHNGSPIRDTETINYFERKIKELR